MKDEIRIFVINIKNRIRCTHKNKLNPLLFRLFFLLLRGALAALLLRLGRRLLLPGQPPPRSGQ